LHDTSSRLGGIQAPVLVVHGDADALVPAEAARVLVRGIPNATLLTLAAAGHL